MDASAVRAIICHGGAWCGVCGGYGLGGGWRFCLAIFMFFILFFFSPQDSCISTMLCRHAFISLIFFSHKNVHFQKTPTPSILLVAPYMMYVMWFVYLV